MLIKGYLPDLSADFQRAEISSGAHTHRIVPYRVFMGVSTLLELGTIGNKSELHSNRVCR